MTEAATARAGPRRLGPILATICCIAAFSIGTIQIYAPSIPGMARDLGTTLGLVQLTLTAFLVGNALAQPVVGGLSDRFGRRAVLLSGMTVWLIGNVAAALAPNIDLLIVARFIQAVGTAAGLAVTRAMVGDLFDRSSGARAMSYIVLANSVGPMMAPFLGGWIDVWFGWRWSFGFLVLAAALLLVAAWRILPETNRARSTGPIVRTMLASQAWLLRQPGFWAFALVNMGTFGAYFIFIAAGPASLIEGVGISVPLYGTLLMALTGAFICGSFLSARLGRRLPLERIIDLGTLGAAMSGAILLAAQLLADRITPWHVMLPILLFSTSQGLCQANVITGITKIDTKRAGAASGLVGSLQIFGGMVGTLIAIALPPASAVAMAFPFAVVAALTAISWRLLRRHAVATGAR